MVSRIMAWDKRGKARIYSTECLAGNASHDIENDS
jgi:hypothetical protein